MSLPRFGGYKAVHIPFLDEIPAHWELRRLKHVAEVFPSNVDKKAYDDQIPVRLCNYTDVYYNECITTDMELMSATATAEQIERFTLRADDVIITKDSETADDIAVAAHVPEALPGVVCGYHLAMVRPLLGFSGAFAKRFFDTHFARAQFAVAANGLTRVGLGQYELKNALIPVPPLEEQRQVVDFIALEVTKIDMLLRDIGAEHDRLTRVPPSGKSFVRLLMERRAALISAAVTGQIDVRQLAASEAA